MNSNVVRDRKGNIEFAICTISDITTRMNLHFDLLKAKEKAKKANRLNALKLTSEGFIEFGYFLEKPNLTFYVKDSGMGISPKNHKIIFERFSQETRDISSKHGGLGLSIAKENAQLLGGDIVLESEKGEGSTFYVSIPYKPVQEQNTGLSDNQFENLNTEDNYTILVAEDEEVNYLYIEALFEQRDDENYNLIHAKNGKRGC